MLASIFGTIVMLICIGCVIYMGYVIFAAMFRAILNLICPD